MITIEFIDMRFHEKFGTTGVLKWKTPVSSDRFQTGNMYLTYDVIALLNAYDFDYWTGATGHPLLF